MKYKFILLIIFVIAFTQGCSVDDKSNNTGQSNENESIISLEPKEEPTQESTLEPPLEPTAIPTEESKNFTVRNDILFDIHNNDFIFIEGQNMTVDGNNSSMELDIDNDGENEFFVISLDTPNGTKLMGIKGDMGINLLDLFTEEDFSYINAFDSDGFPLEDYYFQMSFIDLNNDGVKEIIVSAGNLLVEEVSVILKLTDSADVPFVRVGSVVGQEFMYLDEKNHIIVPYGSKGLVEEYMYEDGKLFQAN